MRRWVLGGLATGGLAIAGYLLVTARRFEIPGRPSATALPPMVMTDTLRRGESLGELFGRHGIVAPDLYGLVTSLGLDPTRLPEGWVAQFSHPADHPVASRVTVRTTPEEELSAVRVRNAWQLERAPIRWNTRAIRVEGSVSTSVHDAMLAAPLDEALGPDQRIRLAWDVADVFAWQVDFSREIQPGDRIVVLLEWLESERGETRVGKVLAATLEVGRRDYAGFRFALPDGRVQYFDAAGVSLRRAFLKAPVEFRRISSGFTNRRFHPILRVNRPHQGVDYAAAAGTPVLAAGDGFVVTANWSGNYGRLVELRHRNGITTRYAHLSGFGPGIRPQARVLQGDVIGYVGSSGLATAVHLHYEFRVNGAARNPSTVDLGDGTPLPAELLPRFAEERERFRALLEAEPVSSAGPSAP
ncbi:MAG: hypothetical protein FJ206_15365 [Gemmatimonadetes bacterium]|nr:hypothetical protein [Gemmatimonadota bacterium]